MNRIKVLLCGYSSAKGNSILKEGITFQGVAILLICGVTPLMRYLIGGRGLLTWALIPAIILFLIGFKRVLALKKVQLLVIIISFWLMVSSIYSPEGFDFSIESAKVQICTILIFLFLINTKEEKYLLVLSYASAVFFIYCYFFKSEYRLGGIRKYIYITDSVWLDPNMVIASFIIPAILTVYLLLQKKMNIVLRIALIVFLGFSLYCAFLGGSRGGLIGITVGILILLLKEVEIKKKVILPSIVMVFSLIVIILFVRKFIPQDLLSRMTLESIQRSGGSGRFEIYKRALTEFFSGSNLFRFLFGYGKESCQLVLGTASHNILIDYLWDLGVLGLLFHCCVLLSILKFCIHSSSSVAIASVFGVAIWSLTLSTSNQLIYWVLLYTCIVIANNHKIMKNGV